MNSTERLLACLKGQVPDRVPISTYELVGWADGEWENKEPSYRGLMEFIRQNTDCIYMTDIGMSLKWNNRPETVVEKWDEGQEHFIRSTLTTPTRTLTKLRSYVDDVKTVWTRKHWCEDLDDLNAFLSLSWQPGKSDFSDLQRAWTNLGDTRGLPMISLPDALCDISELFEFGNFTILAMTKTAAILRAVEIAHQRRVAELEAMLQGPVKNTIWRIVGPEYCLPPYMPPELYRKFITPFDKVYIEMIQSAGGFARIHQHGKCGKVLDQVREMAPAAMDPIEPPPDGDAEIRDVKAAIGDSVCLMGGIELKHMEICDEKFVENLTRRVMAEGKPGGRFVIMPTAAPINIPLNPQTEKNYRVFIETALETGNYS